MTMLKYISAAALGAIVALVAVITLVLPAPASASVAAPAAMFQPAVTAVQHMHAADSPERTALHALESFEAHPSAARLDRLVMAGFHLPVKPDQADIFQLAADYEGGDLPAALGTDAQYAYEDYTNCSGC